MLIKVATATISTSSLEHQLDNAQRKKKIGLTHFLTVRHAENECTFISQIDWFVKFESIWLIKLCRYRTRVDCGTLNRHTTRVDCGTLCWHATRVDRDTLNRHTTRVDYDTLCRHIIRVDFGTLCWHTTRVNCGTLCGTIVSLYAEGHPTLWRPICIYASAHTIVYWNR